MNSLVKKMLPHSVWKYLRERKILANHARVARVCNTLIDSYCDSDEKISIQAKKKTDSTRMIWQYWAQGYDDVPSVVKECLESVDKHKGDYTVVRLDDTNVKDYVDIPESVVANCRAAGLAHYSDVLRVALLSAYGGLWIDATVKLTGPIPDFSGENFFMFQRNPDEPEKSYWENVYSYYFGWASGYRVNSLNSFIYSKRGSLVISTLYALLVKYWEDNDNLPDYFFFQILFDVLINGRMKGQNCSIVSDCLPHMLQQYRNDKSFSLFTEEEIYKKTTIHKLTYKSA